MGLSIGYKTVLLPVLLAGTLIGCGGRLQDDASTKRSPQSATPTKNDSATDAATKKTLPANGPLPTEDQLRVWNKACTAFRKALADEYGQVAAEKIPVGDLPQNGYVIDLIPDKTHWLVAWQSPAGGDYCGHAQVRKADHKITHLCIVTPQNKAEAVERAMTFLKSKNIKKGKPIHIESGAHNYIMKFETSERENAAIGPLILTVWRDGGTPRMNTRR